MRTRFQISAGGVVYRLKSGRPEFALTLRSGAPVWCLPKGLVEKGESLESTAAREIHEETGLTGANEGRIDAIEYWYVSKEEATRFHKKVYFFLFRGTGGSPQAHDWEVAEVRWFPLDEALAHLAYAGEREVVAKAATMIGQAGRA